MLKLLIIFGALAIAGFGQVSSVAARRVIKYNTLPVTCAASDVGYQISDTTFYKCSPANTWAVFGGGGIASAPSLATTFSAAATTGSYSHNYGTTAHAVECVDTSNHLIFPTTIVKGLNSDSFTWAGGLTADTVCVFSVGGTGTGVAGQGNLTTVGAVPYVSASGTLNQDQTAGGQFFWDATNHWLGVGTATPLTPLQVSSTATGLVRGIMSAQYSTGTQGARFIGRKARGTEAVPLIVVTGDTLYNVVAEPYDGANYLQMGAIRIEASGTVAATRVPTQIVFATATDAAPSVLTDRWTINNAGHLLAVTDNVYDIGASGATRPRNLYVSTNIIAGGNLAAGAAAEIDITSRLSITSPSSGVMTLTDWAATSFNRLQFGGTTSSFPSLKRSTTIIQARLADDSAYAPFRMDYSQTMVYTVAGLPTCNAGLEGATLGASDLLAPTFLTAATGGGAVHGKVYCNGTAWVTD